MWLVFVVWKTSRARANQTQIIVLELLRFPTIWKKKIYIAVGFGFFSERLQPYYEPFFKLVMESRKQDGIQAGENILPIKPIIIGEKFL